MRYIFHIQKENNMNKTKIFENASSVIQKVWSQCVGSIVDGERRKKRDVKKDKSRLTGRRRDGEIKRRKAEEERRERECVREEPRRMERGLESLCSVKQTKH